MYIVLRDPHKYYFKAEPTGANSDPIVTSELYMAAIFRAYLQDSQIKTIPRLPAGEWEICAVELALKTES